MVCRNEEKYWKRLDLFHSGNGNYVENYSNFYMRIVLLTCKKKKSLKLFNSSKFPLAYTRIEGRYFLLMFLKLFMMLP